MKATERGEKRKKDRTRRERMREMHWETDKHNNFPKGKTFISRIQLFSILLQFSFIEDEDEDW